jgi:hypothetical protein
MYVIQKFHNNAWCDAFVSQDVEEVKHQLRQFSLLDPDNAYRMRNVPDPVSGTRYVTAEGAMIVQVVFDTGGHRYAYACPVGESYKIGDRVAVPANFVSPDGGEAVIVGVGTDYGGELSVIKGKL